MSWNKGNNRNNMHGATIKITLRMSAPPTKFSTCVQTER